MENGKTGGDGKTSPFGDGKGSVHGPGGETMTNFLKDPKMGTGGDSKGARDFSAEKYPQKNLEEGSDFGNFDPGSVPEGGKLPFPSADPSRQEQSRENSPGVAEQAPKPFKNLR